MRLHPSPFVKRFVFIDDNNLEYFFDGYIELPDTKEIQLYIVKNIDLIDVPNEIVYTHLIDDVKQYFYFVKNIAKINFASYPYYRVSFNKKNKDDLLERILNEAS